MAAARRQFEEVVREFGAFVNTLSTPKDGRTFENAVEDGAKLGAAIIGAMETVERRLGPNDPPQRYVGPWTESDLQRAKEGKGPLDFVPAKDARGQRMPLQLHRDQMPGSGVHEVAPGNLEHEVPGMHPNPRTQGVTDKMREADRQLHWRLRGEEMGNPPLDRR
jgi:hypothetical protein